MVHFDRNISMIAVFRAWIGRHFFSGKSHLHSSLPSEEMKTSATLTWNSQLNLLPSRHPVSATPSAARNRTTSRTLTIPLTSTRVRGSVGYLLSIASHRQKWQVTLFCTGREELDGDEPTIILILFPYCVRVCVSC